MRRKFLGSLITAAAVVSLFSQWSCKEEVLQQFTESVVAGYDQEIETAKTRSVDILFVIDDSGSMLEEQKALIDEFEKFSQQLEESGADYRLAVISTSSHEIKILNESALIHSQNINFQNLIKNLFNDTDGNYKNFHAFKKECEDYLKDTKLSTELPYIQSKKENASTSSNETSSDNLGTGLVKYFKCISLLGTEGSPIEHGFGTSLELLEGTNFSSINQSLINKSYQPKPLDSEYQAGISNFLREGSLLAVVFVTDENDCTVLEGTTDIRYGKTDTNNSNTLCETLRNIEDSCTLGGWDQVQEHKHNSELEGYLTLHNGLSLNSLNQEWSGFLRQKCIEGDRELLEAVLQKLADPIIQDENLSVEAKIQKLSELPIDCPPIIKTNENGKKEVTGVKCQNKLMPRSIIKQRLLSYVVARNLEFYKKSKEIEEVDESDEETRIKKYFEYANNDIIIANIINRDFGVRFNQKFRENWCQAGAQGYRYQYFGDMFNAPILAPICCLEKFGSTCAKIDESTKK